MDPELFRHPHQIRKRIGMHLAHDPSAMNLDGEFSNVQFCCNLLVQQPRNHLLHDFLLARGRRFVPLSQVMYLRVYLSSAAIALDGFLDCLQEFFVIERLGEKFNRSRGGFVARAR